MKVKNWLKKVGIGALLLGGLFSNKVNATGISGFVHDSYDGISGKGCPVKIYRKEVTGGIDTIYATTNFRGRYSKDTGEFDPEPSPGDTLFVKVEKDTLGKKYAARLEFLAGTAYNLELALGDPDKLAKNLMVVVDSVKDTVFINPNDSLLQATLILYKNKSQPVTTFFKKKDTPYNYLDLFINLQNQDSAFTQGDSFKICIEKTRNDTTWFTEVLSAVDTTLGNAMRVNEYNSVHNGAFHKDTLYFPQEKIVTDVTPPVIANATHWPDTTCTGPYDVKFVASDAAGISERGLEYKINDGSVKNVSPDSVKGDTAYCTIDTTVVPDDSVHYRVKAKDASANQNEAYWPASGWQSFKAKAIGIDEDWPVKGKLIVKPSIGARFFANKDVSIYDVTGRKLGTSDAKYDKVANGYRIEPERNGVYFVKGPGKDEIKKIVRVK
jgi:hypothetical protein